jgi:hypothetical protein
LKCSKELSICVMPGVASGLDINYEIRLGGDPMKTTHKQTLIAAALAFEVPKTSESFPPGTYPLKVINKIGIAAAPLDFTVD